MRLETPNFIKVNGDQLRYSVERRRVNHARLEFRADGLLVVLPKGMDEAELFEEKKRWIARKHREIRGVLEKLESMRNGKKVFPIFGEIFEFRDGESLKVDFANKVVECNAQDSRHCRRLERIMKRELLVELEPVVKEYSDKFGAKFNRITVKKLRSKWASCSSRGNLNFSLWLACLPHELIKYVSCHEVAHLIEMNHSRRFWELVGKEFGNYKELEKRLSENSFLVRECMNSTKIDFF
ncbi:MAG: SprT family zinc-dependent metalloprotease [Candidatus Hadarchaeota archaeon]